MKFEAEYELDEIEGFIIELRELNLDAKRDELAVLLDDLELQYLEEIERIEEER